MEPHLTPTLTDALTLIPGDLIFHEHCVLSNNACIMIGCAPTIVQRTMVHQTCL